ncbi:MAG TPA: hypothetical protein VGD98_07610 [Ktedonobacteraceae bacterium]
MQLTTLSITEMSKQMSNQKAHHSSLPDNSEGNAAREGRYYVQTLTEHIFLVRECQSPDGKPGADDIIVRSFDARYDAYNYANSMNE